MIQIESVRARALAILKDGYGKTELSPQAVAVMTALVEAINADRRNGSMVRPSLDEVKLCAAKCGLPEEEAEAFFAHYETNGWYVGKVPMKKWQTAMCVTWKLRWQRNQGNGHRPGSPFAKLKSSKEILLAAEQAARRNPVPSPLQYERGKASAKYQDDYDKAMAAQDEVRKLRSQIEQLNREVASA